MELFEVYLANTFTLVTGDFIVLGMLMVLFVLSIVLILRCSSNS